MRFQLSNNSYLVPVNRSDLFIGKIVYLELFDGCFGVRDVFAFDRDKDTSIVLRSSRWNCVAYPLNKIYEVKYYD